MPVRRQRANQPDLPREAMVDSHRPQFLQTQDPPFTWVIASEEEHSTVGCQDHVFARERVGVMTQAGSNSAHSH